MPVAPLQFLLLVFAGWVNRHQAEVVAYLQEENRVLREPLGGRRPALHRRPAPEVRHQGPRRRPPRAGTFCRPGDARHDPALVPRADRQEVRRHFPPTRRPPWHGHLAATLGRSVRHRDPSWGYTRIRGALRNLGYALGRNTIKRILVEHGLDPVPKLGKTMAWKAFLRRTSA